MRSMTGFGSATRETPFGRVQVEVRSVNNRFLELNLRLGPQFSPLEGNLRALLRDRLERGKVDLTLRFTPADSFIPRAHVNTPLLLSLLGELHAVLPLSEHVRPESFLMVPGVLVAPEDIPVGEEAEAEIRAVVNEAVDKLIAEREREGGALGTVLRGQHARMSALATRIEAARGDIVQKYRERLHARIDEMLGPKAAGLDPGRLEQEVAIFADKADIAEECTRLAAHLDALARAIDEKDKAVGRSLDFLVQEILREVNTTGSKCRDLEIARCVLELKAEVEALKENLANIE